MAEWEMMGALEQKKKSSLFPVPAGDNLSRENDFRKRSSTWAQMLFCSPPLHFPSRSVSHIHMQTHCSVNPWWMSTSQMWGYEVWGFPFPRGLWWLGWDRGPMLRKQSRLHFLLSQRERGKRVSDQCFISFLRQNTDHGGGHGKSRSRRNGGGRGRTLSLSAGPPLPVWGGSPLLGTPWSHPLLRGASVLASNGALNQQPWKANGGVRHAYTHTHARPDYWSGKHTYPHSLSDRKQCCLEQTSTSCVYWGLFTEMAQSKSIMSCPVHHYHHHSRDITAHLLIATLPYLCLQLPANHKHSPHSPHWWPKFGNVSVSGSRFSVKFATNWNTLGLNCLFFPFTHHVDRRPNI